VQAHKVHPARALSAECSRQLPLLDPRTELVVWLEHVGLSQEGPARSGGLVLEQTILPRMACGQGRGALASAQREIAPRTVPSGPRLVGRADGKLALGRGKAGHAVRRMRLNGSVSSESRCLSIVLRSHTCEGAS
jgi:hypothetical protein